MADQDQVSAYLQSKEAERDIAEHLERPDDDHKRTSGGWFGRDDAWQWWHRTEGAWTAVRFNDHATVYFRPEGDRYVVTDLGEAVRALRLRTGLIEGRPGPDLIDVQMAAGTLWYHEKAPAPDLPRAICHVMLASYQVASLNPGGS